MIIVVPTGSLCIQPEPIRLTNPVVQVPDLSTEYGQIFFMDRVPSVDYARGPPLFANGLTFNQSRQVLVSGIS